MADIHIALEDLDELHGKVVLITGGSSGIGLASAKLFQQKGAKVVIGDLNPPKEILEGCSFRKTDVTKWLDLVDLFALAISQHGRIDVVFANAGVTGHDNTFSDVMGKDGELAEPNYSSVQVNLVGLLSTVKLAIHHMRTQESGGAIVVTASKAAYSAPLGGPLYAAAKHGNVGLMRALRKFLPPLHIRLNCIAPGFTDTGMLPKGSVDRLRGLGVVVQTSETVAIAAGFLAVNDKFHARTLQVAENKYRELEGGYEAASELMYGDKAAGRSSISPEAIKEINAIFVTTV